MVEGRGDNSFIEDGVSEDLDQEDLSLGIREVKEVDGDFVGRGVQDQGHNEMEGACFMERLISSTSQNSPCYSQTASACPSNLGQCFAVPRR